MFYRKLICFVIVFWFGITKIYSQDLNKNITEVSFDKEDIILNNVVCLKYSREGNDFKISDLNQKEIIHGQIYNNSDGNFECIITFVDSNKKFSNKKMIGRNGIIFGLLDSNVFEKNCNLNKENLAKFIKEFNELD